MKNFITLLLIILSFSLLIMAGTVNGQDYRNYDITAKFDDTSKPGIVEIKWYRGNVYIEGYDGNEVKIDVKGGGRRSRYSVGKYRGMKKIYDGDAIDVDKKGNKILISSYSLYQNVDIIVKIPKNSSLYVLNQLNGDVEIENINGNIEVETLNGEIDLEKITGSIFAYSTNGEIYASMASLSPDKDFTFTTVNSDIDLSFPVNMKANFNMTTRDEIYTDFDMKPVRSSKMKWQSRSRNKIEYALNGGGTDIDIKSLHGDIYVRKDKK